MANRLATWLLAASLSPIVLIASVHSTLAQASDNAESHEFHPDDLEHEDLFGFTATTETGDRGDKGIGTEHDARLRKRDGRYFALGSKYYFGYAFADNWSIDIAGFGALHRIKNVTSLPGNMNRQQFDGFSVEIAHRLVSRSTSNPFAVTLSFEPRWARVDGGSGFIATSATGEMKLLVDAVVIPGKLFWAFNANLAPSNAQDPANRVQWLKSTGASVSTAVAVAMGARASLGVELRRELQFEGYGLSRLTGQATFAGPTAVYRIAENVSLNGVFVAQIRGHAKGSGPMRLDLDNFERRGFRVALSAGF